MNLHGCNALITGASAGIGYEFALQLAEQAAVIVLVARRGARLVELQEELRRRAPKLPVHHRVVDLADPAQLEELCRWLEQEKITIDFLINNAGLGDVGPFATADHDRISQILKVNVVALTMLTRRLLPAMMAQNRGTVLNVSSSVSFLPLPGFAVYAASKAYVTSFSEAVRAELRGRNITVCSLCPGPVHTEFQTVASRSATAPERIAPELAHVSVQQVVREALRAIENDKALVIPGLLMKAGMFLLRLTPMAVLRLTARFSEKKS
jgi:short-subunit dehydrogenase